MIRAFWREVAFLALFVIAVVILVWLFAHLNNKTPDASENPQRFRIESGGSNVGVALVTDRDTGPRSVHRCTEIKVMSGQAVCRF